MFGKKLIVLLIGSVLFYACLNSNGKKTKVLRDVSITPATSFNDLFFDSSYIDSFVTKFPEFANYTEQYRQYYLHRNFEFAWVDTSGLSEHAHHFYHLQNNYISTVGDSSIYDSVLVSLYDSLQNVRKLNSSMKKDFRDMELMLTGQFFKYAAKVYNGADIDEAELGWYIPRKKIDITASLLDSILRKKSKNAVEDIVVNEQYRAMEKMLPYYLELRKKEGTDTIAHIRKGLRKGDSTRIVGLVKKRLSVLQGEIPLNDSNFFDTVMQRSVKLFQLRHGLTVDGIVGNKMIDELNIPIAKRIQQILVNMERIRWMPADLGARYVKVNIPEYRMYVYDSSKPVLEMNVIVGNSLNNTVIFTEKLKYIVFSPYWNVPESIVLKELKPAMKKDPDYLTKNHMEMTGKIGGIPQIRQKPGKDNALGHIKFLFPNNFNIYLHDTPNRDLFEQSGRGLSHGCIRIQEPKKFAQFLLKEDSLIWTSKKLDSLMHLTKEKWVSIKKPLPVFLVYFTAWVDKNGVMNFRKDIYGHDSIMAMKLFNK